MDSVILKIVPRGTVMRIQNKINYFGVRESIGVSEFLVLRIFLVIGVFLVSCVWFKYGLLVAPFLAIGTYWLMEYLVLDWQIKKRAKTLEKEALFFFEVLTLTLEGGRNLKRALSLTVSNIDSEIALEFKKTLEEIEYGKSLNESLKAMKKRIPSDTINNAILNMIGSNTFGNSITSSMYNQIEYLRNKQMLDIKAEINKLPMKVSIISVVFFVPIMLLIILAPVLINYLMK